MSIQESTTTVTVPVASSTGQTGAVVKTGAPTAAAQSRPSRRARTHTRTARGAGAHLRAARTGTGTNSPYARVPSAAAKNTHTTSPYKRSPVTPSVAKEILGQYIAKLERIERTSKFPAEKTQAAEMIKKARARK